MLPLSTMAVAATMLYKQAQTNDIKALFESVRAKQKHVSHETFVEQLGLEPEYDSTSDFSASEFALLGQLRGEQLALNEQNYWWRECYVVATVLYNAAVRQLDNPCLKLKKRSFRCIAKHLPGIDTKLSRPAKALSSISIMRMKHDTKADDTINSEDDEWLQKKLFNLLREKNVVKNRTQVFCNVYDVAGCLCSTITRKSKAWLSRRWTTLRTAENRSERMKLVLRVPPGFLTNAVASHESSGLDSSELVELSHPDATASLTTALSITSTLHTVPTLLERDTNSMTSSDVCTSAINCAAQTEQSLTQITTDFGPATSMPSADMVEIIDDVTRDHLQQFAASIPRVKGKWAKVFTEYTKFNCATKLNAENLRCRLKQKRSASRGNEQREIVVEVPVDRASDPRANASSNADTTPQLILRQIPIRPRNVVQRAKVARLPSGNAAQIAGILPASSSSSQVAPLRHSLPPRASLQIPKSRHSQYNTNVSTYYS